MEASSPEWVLTEQPQCAVTLNSLRRKEQIISRSTERNSGKVKVAEELHNSDQIHPKCVGCRLLFFTEASRRY
ncbi:uncharacterized protein V6R79_025140 [Siganus canaliculatus]